MSIIFEWVWKIKKNMFLILSHFGKGERNWLRARTKKSLSKTLKIWDISFFPTKKKKILFFRFKCLSFILETGENGLASDTTQWKWQFFATEKEEKKNTNENYRNENKKHKKMVIFRLFVSRLVWKIKRDHLKTLKLYFAGYTQF